MNERVAGSRWWAVFAVAMLGCSAGRSASSDERSEVTSRRAALTTLGGLATDALANNGIWTGGAATDLWANGVWADGVWSNGLWNNGIWINGLFTNGVWANGLWANGIWSGGLPGNMAIPGNALRNDPQARRLLQFIYSCAMPATIFDTTLDPNGAAPLVCASDADCGVGYACSGTTCVIPLQGDTGLAINADGTTWWDTGGCDESCQRWISACVLARTNQHGLRVSISMRPPAVAPPGRAQQFAKIQAALATTPTELAEYSLREGAFYGNIFATTPAASPVGPPPNGPATGPIISIPSYYACAGPISSVAGIESLFCAPTGPCVVNVPGMCVTPQSGPDACDGVDSTGANFGCHTSSNPTSPRYAEVLTVYIRDRVTVCGDGVCESTESPTTCPTDCQAAATPPPVITTPADGSKIASAAVSVTGLGAAGATVTVLVDNGVVAIAAVAVDGTFAASVALTIGTHVLTATQTLNGVASDPSADVIVQVVKANGAACSADAECDTDHCVDGVCCEDACGGGVDDCQACSVVAGGIADGLCTPVVDGRTCGTAGACRNAGVCSPLSKVCPADTPVAANTPCDPPPDFCDWIQPTCDLATLSCPAHVAWAANSCTLMTAWPQSTDVGGGQYAQGGVTVTPDGSTSGVSIAVQKLTAPPTCPSSTPAGFKTGSPTQYWQIDTSPPGTVPATVCINYLPVSPLVDQCTLQLRHGDACAWSGPINSSTCDSNGTLCGTGDPCDHPGTICGHVDHFSPFGVFAPEPADIPTVTVPAPMVVGATTATGAVVTFAASAHDAHDGDLDARCRPASGSTFPLRTTTVLCTATNSLGLRGQASFTVSVRVQAPTDGTFFLPPINPDGSSIFKLGSTIPVKFKLTGASAGITDLVAHLTVAKVSSSVTGNSVEAGSTGAANTGDTFRYDCNAHQYVFNLSTKTLSKGTWVLRADLGDGVDHTVNASLR